MSSAMNDASNSEISQTTIQRQKKLDETQAQIDAPLQKALTDFVETHISAGVTITHSWCIWDCAWQADTGNLNVF